MHLLNVVLDVGGGVGRFLNTKQKGIGVRNNIISGKKVNVSMCAG